MTSYYELLEVAKTATKEELAKGYKKAALKWHPDRNIDNKEYAEEMFKKVGNAYDVLKDVNKREIYDRFGEEGLKNNNGMDAGGFNPFDLFSGMFPGGMPGMSGFSGGGRGAPRNDENKPIVHEVICSLKDVYVGAKRQEHIERIVFCNPCEGTGFKDKKVHQCSTCNGKGIQVMIHQIGPGMVQQSTRNCSTCKGSGNDGAHVPCEKCNGQKKSKENIKIDIEIKKGTKKQSQPLILRGKGNQTGPNTFGDVAIIFNVHDDKVYSRKGNDLHRKVDISLRKALLGFKLTLDHIDGKKIVVESSNIINPNSLKKISKLGFMDTNSGLYGDYYIEFNVIFPERYNGKQRQALELVLHKDPEYNEGKNVDIQHYHKLEDTFGTPKGSSRYYNDLDDQTDDTMFHTDGAQNVQCAQQ
jgi:DnaJ family protein A protein 2